MSLHANNKKSDKPNTLYAIFDIFKNVIYKFGVTSDPCDGKNLPGRARKQVDLFNNISGQKRFRAFIILWNIPGRRIALILEKIFIRRHRIENGRSRGATEPKRRRSNFNNSLMRL